MYCNWKKKKNMCPATSARAERKTPVCGWQVANGTLQHEITGYCHFVFYEYHAGFNVYKPHTTHRHISNKRWKRAADFVTYMHRLVWVQSKWTNSWQDAPLTSSKPDAPNNFILTSPGRRNPEPHVRVRAFRCRPTHLRPGPPVWPTAPWVWMLTVLPSGRGSSSVFYNLEY